MHIDYQRWTLVQQTTGLSQGRSAQSADGSGDRREVCSTGRRRAHGPRSRSSKDAIWNLEQVGSVSELMALMEADVRKAKSARAPTAMAKRPQDPKRASLARTGAAPSAGADTRSPLDDWSCLCPRRSSKKSRKPTSPRARAPSAHRRLRFHPPDSRHDARQHLGGDEQVQRRSVRRRFTTPKQLVFALDHDIQNQR